MKVRNIRVQRDDTTNVWNLNGETWHDVVDSGYKKVLGEPGPRRHRDLGDREQVGRLVPPGAHPPDRLQDPEPQRQGRPSPGNSGPKDVVYVGEGEKVRLHHEVRSAPAASTWCTATTCRTRTTT